ncbi:MULTISPECIES: hypothetical protein [Enterobacteriaceae]|uniref:hypothetical protein n=1 Tax=Enterobacteriaceae TaxID=543 RepID=UPI002021F34F|nr:MULTISPECIES: hypothetical protein [Enterobacteriaceae]
MSSEESITESVKQTLKERVANPLWGYIILSWVGFNWKSIAIMCLSEASVVTRIQQITSTEDFYLKTLCYPVVLGFILATFFSLHQQSCNTTSSQGNRMARKTKSRS